MFENAIELCFAVERPTEAAAFFRQALGLTGGVAASKRQAWRFAIIANWLRAAIEAGHVNDADAALSAEAPDLLGAAQSGDEALLRWERGQDWLNDGAAVGAALFYGVGLLLLARASLGRALEIMGRARRQAILADQQAMRRLLGLRISLAEALIMLQRGEAKAAIALLQGLPAGETRIPLHLEVRRVALLARAHMLIGEFSRALTHLHDMLDRLANGGQASSIAAFCLQASRIFLFLNRIEIATGLLDSLERSGLLRKAPEAIAQVKGMRQRIFARTSRSTRGNHPLTAVYEAQASAGSHAPIADSDVAVPTTLWAQPYDHEAELADSLNHVRRQLDAGQIGEARTALDKCFERFAAVDSALTKARLLLAASLVRSREGMINDALDAAREAARLTEAIGAKVDQWQALTVISAIAEHSAERALGLESREKAETLLFSFVKEMDRESGAFFLLDRYEPDDEILGQTLAEIAISATTGASSDFRRLLAIEGRVAAGVRQVFKAARHSRADGPIKHNSINSMIYLTKQMTCFRPKQARLTFVVLRRITLIVLRFGFFVHWKILEIDAGALLSSTQAWHRASRETKIFSELPKFEGSEVMSRGWATAAKNLEMASDDLAAMLGMVDLLDVLPKSINELVIEPDGPLFGFPFSAIKVKNTYLIEHFAITVGSTITVRVTCSPECIHSDGESSSFMADG